MGDDTGLVFERAIIKSHGIRFFQTAFMKPLSARQKNFLYSNLVYGKLRVLAKPCYDLILGSRPSFCSAMSWLPNC